MPQWYGIREAGSPPIIIRSSNLKYAVYRAILRLHTPNYNLPPGGMTNLGIMRVPADQAATLEREFKQEQADKKAKREAARAAFREEYINGKSTNHS